MAIFNAFTKLVESTTNAGAERHFTAAEIGPYVSEGIELNDNESVTFDIENIPVSTSAGEFWISFYVRPEGTGNLCRVDLFDTDFDSDNAVIRLEGDNSGAQMSAQLWNGASFVEQITGPTDVAELIKYDLQLIRSDTVGEMRLYRNNTLEGTAVTSADTNLAAWSNINRVIFRNVGSSSGSDLVNLSAIILADEDTRDMVFVEESLTGVGALDTIDIGGFTEVTDENQGTSAQMTAVGRQLTVLGDIDNTFDAGFTVDAVVTSLVVNKTGTSVDAIEALSRIGGANFTTAPKTITADDPSLELLQFVQATNPNTAAAWTVAEVEASEGGFESA